ncbi:MAG TPA: 4-(cytidine 5'-diphospho)-2-C-methyl-D-erythritol kinase [Pyrinomonadaceae bacterium]|nr:4-(cytidine 5'-diphospho)-2-C-methyl-D-erythritol kinase [Pyrinomonadaceae bacterium]
MTPLSLSLPSFAKINWSLQILGRRPDGYHEVKTVLQTISLHDDLDFEVTNSGDISLSCTDPEIPADEQNLIIRAALALKARHGNSQGARIQLHKRIPAQAGLGGGSSNAAVSLLALNHLWDLKITPAELIEIAAGLGADVPFFLLGGRAVATGTGATVSSILDNTVDDVYYLIVITPRARVSTAKAYAALSVSALTTPANDPILSSSREEAKIGRSPLWALANSMTNDFEPVIFDIEPEISRTRETLLQAGALKALLAGSGASVFGIFPDRAAQQRAIKEVKLEAGWRVFPCVTVSRHEYLRAVGSWDISFLRSFNSGSDIGA